jgi:hypothetical protein
VQSAPNSTLARDFEIRLRLFHKVFNRTVENFHAMFTDATENHARVANELLQRAASELPRPRSSVVTFLSATLIAQTK